MIQESGIREGTEHGQQACFLCPDPLCFLDSCFLPLRLKDYFPRRSSILLTISAEKYHVHPRSARIGAMSWSLAGWPLIRIFFSSKVFLNCVREIAFSSGLSLGADRFQRCTSRPRLA